MNRTIGRTPTERFADRREIAEDLALEALLAIEHAWARAHREGEPLTDRWGEGASRLRLADLGFDPRLRTYAMIGACPRHGEFVSEWTGLLADRLPEALGCTRVADGETCRLYGPVRPIVRPAKAA